MRSQTLCLPRDLIRDAITLAGGVKISDVVPMDICHFPEGAFSFISRTIVDESSLSSPNADLARKFPQVMPYIIVHSEEKGYLTYSRDTTAGEQRLLGSRSIGFGGHATLSDLALTEISDGDNSKQVFDVLKTLSNTASRELREELLSDQSTDDDVLSRLRFTGWMVYDFTPSTDETQLAQGLAHVGIILQYDVTDVEHTINETVEAQRLEWHTDPESMLATLGEFESWSQLVIRNYLTKGVSQ